MKFKSTILLGGKTATGIVVPPEVVESLGGGRLAVVVTVGGHTYRSTIASRGGQFLIPLSAENREKAGVSAGDAVQVEVEADTAPRVIEVPADLAAALATDGEAKAFFDGLSNSHKSSYTLWIEQAKKAETREARVTKAVEMLHEGRRQR